MINALSALLVFVFIIYFFRMLAGGGEGAKRKMEDAVNRAREKAEEAKRKRGTVTAEDMTPCTVCDAYIPKSNLSNCGRGDCPY